MAEEERQQEAVPVITTDTEPQPQVEPQSQSDINSTNDAAAAVDVSESESESEDKAEPNSTAATTPAAALDSPLPATDAIAATAAAVAVVGESGSGSEAGATATADAVADTTADTTAVRVDSESGGAANSTTGDVGVAAAAADVVAEGGTGDEDETTTTTAATTSATAPLSAQDSEADDTGGAAADQEPREAVASAVEVNESETAVVPAVDEAVETPEQDRDTTVNDGAHEGSDGADTAESTTAPAMAAAATDECASAEPAATSTTSAVGGAAGEVGGEVAVDTTTSNNNETGETETDAEAEAETEGSDGQDGSGRDRSDSTSSVDTTVDPSESGATATASGDADNTPSDAAARSDQQQGVESAAAAEASAPTTGDVGDTREHTQATTTTATTQATATSATTDSPTTSTTSHTDTSPSSATHTTPTATTTSESKATNGETASAESDPTNGATESPVADGAAVIDLDNVDYEVYEAIYDYEPTDPKQQLKLTAGERIGVVTKDTEHDDWWTAVNEHGQYGFVPTTYIKPLGAVDPAQATGVKIDRGEVKNETVGSVSVSDRQAALFASLPKSLGGQAEEHSPQSLSAEPKKLDHVVRSRPAAPRNRQISGRYARVARRKSLPSGGSEVVAIDRAAAGGLNATSPSVFGATSPPGGDGRSARAMTLPPGAAAAAAASAAEPGPDPGPDALMGRVAADAAVDKTTAGSSGPAPGAATAGAAVEPQPISGDPNATNSAATTAANTTSDSTNATTMASEAVAGSSSTREGSGNDGDNNSEGGGSTTSNTSAASKPTRTKADPEVKRAIAEWLKRNHPEEYNAFKSWMKAKVKAQNNADFEQWKLDNPSPLPVAFNELTAASPTGEDAVLGPLWDAAVAAIAAHVAENGDDGGSGGVVLPASSLTIPPSANAAGSTAEPGDSLPPSGEASPSVDPALKRAVGKWIKAAHPDEYRAFKEWQKVKVEMASSPEFNEWLDNNPTPLPLPFSSLIRVSESADPDALAAAWDAAAASAAAASTDPTEAPTTSPTMAPADTAAASTTSTVPTAATSGGGEGGEAGPTSEGGGDAAAVGADSGGAAEDTATATATPAKREGGAQGTTRNELPPYEAAVEPVPAYEANPGAGDEGEEVSGAADTNANANSTGGTDPEQLTVPGAAGDTTTGKSAAAPSSQQLDGNDSSCTGTSEDGGDSGDAESDEEFPGRRGRRPSHLIKEVAAMVETRGEEEDDDDNSDAATGSAGFSVKRNSVGSTRTNATGGGGSESAKPETIVESGGGGGDGLTGVGDELVEADGDAEGGDAEEGSDDSDSDSDSSSDTSAASSDEVARANRRLDSSLEDAMRLNIPEQTALLLIDCNASSPSSHIIELMRGVTAFIFPSMCTHPAIVAIDGDSGEETAGGDGGVGGDGGDRGDGGSGEPSAAANGTTDADAGVGSALNVSTTDGDDGSTGEAAVDSTSGTDTNAVAKNSTEPTSERAADRPTADRPTVDTGVAAAASEGGAGEAEGTADGDNVDSRADPCDPGITADQAIEVLRDAAMAAASFMRALLSFKPLAVSASSARFARLFLSAHAATEFKTDPPLASVLYYWLAAALHLRDVTPDPKTPLTVNRSGSVYDLEAFGSPALSSPLARRGSAFGTTSRSASEKSFDGLGAADRSKRNSRPGASGGEAPASSNDGAGGGRSDVDGSGEAVAEPVGVVDSGAGDGRPPAPTDTADAESGAGANTQPGSTTVVGDTGASEDGGTDPDGGAAVATESDDDEGEGEDGDYEYEYAVEEEVEYYDEDGNVVAAPGENDIVVEVASATPRIPKKAGADTLSRQFTGELLDSWMAMLENDIYGCAIDDEMAVVENELAELESALVEAAGGLPFRVLRRKGHKRTSSGGVGGEGGERVHESGGRHRRKRRRTGHRGAAGGTVRSADEPVGDEYGQRGVRRSESECITNSEGEAPVQLVESTGPPQYTAADSSEALLDRLAATVSPAVAGSGVGANGGGVGGGRDRGDSFVSGVGGWSPAGSGLDEASESSEGGSRGDYSYYYEYSSGGERGLSSGSSYGNDSDSDTDSDSDSGSLSDDITGAASDDEAEGEWKFYRVVRAHVARELDELSLVPGNIVAVCPKQPEYGRWLAEHNGRLGKVAAKCLQLMSTPGSATARGAQAPDSAVPGEAAGATPDRGGEPQTASARLAALTPKRAESAITVNRTWRSLEKQLSSAAAASAGIQVPTSATTGQPLTYAQLAREPGSTLHALALQQGQLDGSSPVGGPGRRRTASSDLRGGSMTRSGTRGGRSVRGGDTAGGVGRGDPPDVSPIAWRDSTTSFGSTIGDYESDDGGATPVVVLAADGRVESRWTSGAASGRTPVAATPPKSYMTPTKATAAKARSSGQGSRRGGGGGGGGASGGGGGRGRGEGGETGERPLQPKMRFDMAPSERLGSPAPLSGSGGGVSGGVGSGVNGGGAVIDVTASLPSHHGRSYKTKRTASPSTAFDTHARRTLVAQQSSPVSPRFSTSTRGGQRDAPVLSSPSVCQFGGRTYVYGGAEFSGGSRVDSDKLFVFREDTGRWAQTKYKGQGPGPRHGHTVCVAGTVMFLYGGRRYSIHPKTGESRESYCKSVVYMLDLKRLVWEAPVIEGVPPPATASVSAMFGSADDGTVTIVSTCSGGGHVGPSLESSFTLTARYWSHNLDDVYCRVCLGSR